MSCTACGEHIRKTEAQRSATHSARYGTSNVPPRGTGLKTIVCQICGQRIEVPGGAKSFTCSYCGSIYDVTTPKLENGVPVSLVILLFGVAIGGFLGYTIAKPSVTAAKMREIRAAYRG